MKAHKQIKRLFWPLAVLLMLAMTLPSCGHNKTVCPTYKDSFPFKLSKKQIKKRKKGIIGNEPWKQKGKQKKGKKGSAPGGIVPQ